MKALWETKKQRKHRQRNKKNKPVWDKKELKTEPFWSKKWQL